MIILGIEYRLIYRMHIVNPVISE